MGLKTRLKEFLNDPKNLQEIYSRFREEKQTTIRGRLNEGVDKEFKRLGKGVYVSIKGNAKALLITGDSWKVIRDIESNSIDAVITDSPYTALNKHLATGTTRKLNGAWSFQTKDIDSELYSEIYRILKPGAHFFTFLPADAKDTLDFNNKHISLGKKIGFEFNKRFIWDKMAIGMGYNGRARYEQILFFSKGPRRMPCDLSIPDLLSHKRISPSERIHETEKPVELLMDLVKFCTKPGEWILDPFAGSFSTIKAAQTLGRNSIGIEINQSYTETAIRELEAEELI